MPNANYIKGRRKEYAIVKEYRSLGFDIVQRTAGSHSPIDVIAIHKKNKEIVFIQSKPNSMSIKQQDKIREEHKELNDVFNTSFIVT